MRKKKKLYTPIKHKSTRMHTGQENKATRKKEKKKKNDSK